MAFGQSKTQKPVFEKSESAFLDLKEGDRFIRVPQMSTEIRVKRFWIAKNSDNTWELKFGFTKGDSRPTLPVNVQRYDAVNEEWDGNWSNPFSDWIKENYSEDEQKGKYAREEFLLNVIDLTPVRFDGDGKVYYTTPNGWPKEVANAVNTPHNRMRILQASSGNIGGKHFYNKLLSVAEGTTDEEGNPIPLHTYNVKISTTGTGLDTVRDCQPTFNRKPLTDELLALPMYDVWEFTRLWPNDALIEVLNVGNAEQIQKDLGIPRFPKLVEVPF